MFDSLLKRGFFDATSHKDLCSQSSLRFYIGFDPTADSLHLGHLVGIMAVNWLCRLGHEAFIIIGGATGRIGDPSGKSLERPLLTHAEIEENVKKIGEQIQKILPQEYGRLYHIVNNNEWWSSMSVVDFLRDIGKSFRLGPMLAKETVKQRLNSDEGISFTEFSYQILQSYDFYYLWKNHGVNLQIGGSDQWGNITAGIEFIRKKEGTSVYGATFPLLTRSDGKKFGKSEGGAVWLDADKYSVFNFYQYLLRIPDADVIKLMKMLTLMTDEEISDFENRMLLDDYEPNSAQKRLAEEVTRFVHKQEGLDRALKATEGLMPQLDVELSVETLKEIAHIIPHVELLKEEIIGAKITDVAVKIGLATSKGEASRLIKNGGAYLNNLKILDPYYSIRESDAMGNTYLLFAAGKKKKILLILKAI
ncbi:MAG: tyrosine--tRNA ligase [Rhabdochlamydiaceae bacterium]